MNKKRKLIVTIVAVVLIVAMILPMALSGIAVFL